MAECGELKARTPGQAADTIVCRHAGVVQRRLQIVNISWGSKPSDAVGMHVAAWVLGESLMHLATVWSPAEVRDRRRMLRLPVLISLTYDSSSGSLAACQSLTSVYLFRSRVFCSIHTACGCLSVASVAQMRLDDDMT